MTKPFYQRVTCKSGFSMSVQASWAHYCAPRADYPGTYTEVEVGFPSAAEETLAPYSDSYGGSDPTQTVYGYVPVEVVRALIVKHGGIVSGTLPPGV